MENSKSNSQAKKTSLRYFIPNFVTFLNIIFGLLAIFICLKTNSKSHRLLASIFIILAGCCDGIDGVLARRLNAESLIGKQLDSFADIISFGLAPMIVTMATLSVLTNSFFITALLFGVIIFYVSAGIIRLARYNVVEYQKHFTGLPITASGLLLSVYFLFANAFNWNGILFGIMSLSLVCLLAILMVSKFKFPRAVFQQAESNQGEK